MIWLLLLRHWKWVRAGWRLGKLWYEISEQNARIKNPRGVFVVEGIEWDGRDWIVTDLKVRT